MNPSHNLINRLKVIRNLWLCRDGYRVRFVGFYPLARSLTRQLIPALIDCPVPRPILLSRSGAMIITSVRIQNLRSFADATIPMNDYVCLVGPNGSGDNPI